MTSTSPASMGGPLSEAEAAAGRIRAYLEACSDANSFGREIRWELRDADGHPYNLPRADLVAVLDALGVLEGQLATSVDMIRAAVHTAICEDSQEHCAEWRGKCVKASEAAVRALGLSEAAGDE